MNEISRGRLAGFEQRSPIEEAALEVTTDPPRPRLPPRRRSAPSTGAPEPSDGGEQVAAPAPRPSPAADSGADAQPAGGGSGPMPDAVRRRRPGRPPRVLEGGLDEAGLDQMRPSNVTLPVALLEAVQQECADKSLSHGILIVLAVEATHEDLAELIHPATRVGGSVFASRINHRVRAAEGPTAPLGFRLRQRDLMALDALVERVGASSRAQLVTAALSAYLASERP